MRKINRGGGWAAVRYTLKKAREVGGFFKLWKALRSKNACKTCALGMGGQAGGMVNESGSFPEVCKKSIQAMASDMQPAITQDFWSRHSIAELQSWSPRQLETAGRLIQPVMATRGATHFETVTWQHAYEQLEKHYRSFNADETFWYFSGRSSNEAGFLLQLAARTYGTNNVNNCSYYCHQASGVGLNQSLGTGTATVTLEDLESSDLVILVGGNPASNHPRLMTSLMHLKRRGGKVIVVNPVRELGLENFSIPSDPRSLLFGSQMADLTIQPDIGGDLAFLSGVAKAIIESGATADSFLEQNCNGLNDYVDWIMSLDWEDLGRQSGVSEADMRKVADLYAQSNSAIFAWTMGITHHVHGVENVNAIVNLALLRGMVGRTGAGLMPIRGHSNVQGIGSVGVTPQLKEHIFQALQERGLQLPTTPGLDTMACVEAAHEGRLKAGFCLGGNLYGSNPDANYAAEALSKLKLLTSLSTTLNTGHIHAIAEQTIVLPVLARDEEPQPTTQESMFNYVRLSDGGEPRHPGPRSEISVIAELGSRIVGDLPEFEWEPMRQTDTIRQWISGVVPGYEAIRDIAANKSEFQIRGRTFHEPKFATPDGKANILRYEIPELETDERPRLRMMTVRSEGQFNTVVYEEEDLYRGQERRDLVLLHPDDIRKLGLTEDQPIVVRSDTGEISGYLARAFDRIKPGNVLMYFPEANALVSRRVDPQSKTPAFKSTLVSISPA